MIVGAEAENVVASVWPLMHLAQWSDVRPFGVRSVREFEDITADLAPITVDGALIRKIPVGDGPHGLCVWPQPERYSLGHTGVTR